MSIHQQTVYINLYRYITILYYHNTVGGNAWIQTTLPSVDWKGAASDSTGVYLAVCQYGGSIYTSSDAGAIWTQTSAPPGLWGGIASDITGVYLAAINYQYGIYTSTSGMYYVNT